MPVAASIILSVIAGILPGKFGRPVLQLAADPIETWPTQQPDEDGVCEESGSVTETEPDTTDTFESIVPHVGTTFAASQVTPEMPDIACDVCYQAIVMGNCQMCWVHDSGHKVWFHAECCPTFANQEGKEFDVLQALVDCQGPQHPVVQIAITEAISTLMDITDDNLNPQVKLEG